MEKSCPNLPGPTWKMNCPLLLNHERTVISHIILESWVKFHLITARPVESRNHLNRACLTKWSMLKEQHIMPRYKQIQEQMRKKNSWHVSVWKGLWSPFLRLWDSSQPHYCPKTCDSGEPSQEWPANQNYSKSATTTHPGGHKRTQNNI